MRERFIRKLSGNSVGNNGTFGHTGTIGIQDAARPFCRDEYFVTCRLAAWPLNNRNLPAFQKIEILHDVVDPLDSEINT